MNKTFFLYSLTLSMTFNSISIASGATNDKARQFKELLRSRIHARLRNDSVAYNATQAEFVSRSAEARATAKELYAQCPYAIVGLFSSSAKKRSTCELLAHIAHDPNHYDDVEIDIYLAVKKEATESDAKNAEIIDQKLKAYKRRASRCLTRTKDGLKRELDPSGLVKDIRKN